MKANERKFELGTVVTTPQIRWKMKDDESFMNFVKLSLGKYTQCNWGNTSPEDCSANNEALENKEGRIFAVYNRYGTTDKIWIITEADHSITTIMFPDEY